jgi:lysophospholipase L1-like esterase
MLVLGMLVLACSSESSGDWRSPTPSPSAGIGSVAGASSGAGGMLGSAGSVPGVAGVGEPAGAGGAAGTAGATVLGGAGGIGGSSESGAAGTGGAPGPRSDWQFYGRWDLTHQGKAITVNSGSHVSASFNGTGISANFDVSGNTGKIPTVSIKIDATEVVEKQISEHLELGYGLPAGVHEVTLFVRGMDEHDARWNPPLVASTVFLGFTVADGAIVQTPRPKRVKIEFLGDSITEGVNVHSKGPNGQTTANWTTDGPRGYAALTAMKLGAEWRQVGFGRQGLTVVGSGGVPKAKEAFNFFYAGVARDDWQPDAVVVNQGTNDRSASGATFANVYLAFLGEIRAAYPDAKIVALRPFVGAFGTEIAKQVQSLTSRGDAKVYYVDTAGWTTSGDFTDSLHPNQAGSVKIGDKLVAALQPILN